MTQPLEPLPEAYVGDNNPYRGIEQHGVEADTRPQGVPGYGDTVAVQFMEPAPLQDPVPVIVVNESPKELHSWDTTPFTVTERMMQVMGRDERRTSLVITNEGPNTVYLAPRPTSGTYMGFPLAMDATLSLDTEDEVWGVCAASETGTLRVLWEYAKTLPNK